ncbi:phage portal protein family protein [Bacillus cereus group sp. IBL03679]|uniref:phage portal protein family protein n=1 Tax=Bacillus cereus group sp. IBL03679 TaxID=3240095 RepID=UPI003D2F586E
MGLFTGLRDKMPWNYAQKKQEKELLELAREIGLYKDDTYERDNQTDFNPSDFGLEVYDRMLTDGQVKAGSEMIKLSSTAKGFTVTGDDEETRKYAEFILENFESIQGNMEDYIREILSAIDYGYSCTEKVFAYQNGQIRLKKLKTLDPYKVSMKTNGFGDIEYIKQSIGTKEIKIPANKVCWYAYDKKFGNLYGNSMLRTAYKHWLIKDKLYRFANIAYERYGTPLLVGNVQDAKDVGKMEKILRSINGMTGLAISGGDSIKAVQMSNADFIGYIEHHDRKIMESMLIPPMLLGLSRGQSGSYALSGNQFDIFMIRLESLQRDVKSLIEEEIIRPLIDLNFPNVKRYPSFQFRPLADKDTEKMARVFQMMIDKEVVAPSEDWIREELGMPAISEEAKREIQENKTLQSALHKAKEDKKKEDPGAKDTEGK